MGFLAALVSALFSTSKDLVSKKLAFEIDGTASAFASFLFALPYYVVVIVVLWSCGYQSLGMTEEGAFLIFLRSVTDTFAELCKMYAFMHADISLVVCIFAAYPVILLLISPLVTGDPLTPAMCGAMGLIVGGSLVLGYRSPTTGFHGQRRGILFALVSALFFALNTCLDRLAVQQASPVMSGFSMTLLSALLLLPWMFRKGRVSMLPARSGFFFLRGFFEVGFMVSKLTALQYFSAPVVVGVQKFSVILSIIGGRVIFHEKDFLRRLCAGILIISGIIMMVFTS